MKSVDISIAEQLGSVLLFSRQVEGGCIHDARRLDFANGQTIFVKSSSDARALLLDDEIEGLALLSPHIRVPKKLAEGTHEDGTRWIALEWLNLQGLGQRGWASFGRQLKALHEVTVESYGLDRDNFIGTMPQQNYPTDSWVEFFIMRRIQPQLRYARKNFSHLSENGLLDSVEKILIGHSPLPTLVHGDLWCGNVSALEDESVVVYDPAVYYGDPEVDLSSLELFGTPLSQEFRENYGEFRPERERRRPVYDLYHALNHLNLFGSGYLPLVHECQRRMRQFV